MRNTFDYYSQDIYLAHHGIKGQKWGIRRFQNEDGSLTSTGAKRYGSIFDRIKNRNQQKAQDKLYKKEIGDSEIKHIDAFDKTKDGAKLLKAYEKEIHRMETSATWGTDDDQDRFFKAERQYLSEQGRYVAKQIHAQYGDKGLKNLAESYRVNSNGDVGQLIDGIANAYVNTHGY